MITDSETFRPVTVNLDTTSSFTDPVLLRETANARLYRMSKAGKHFIIKTTKDNSAMQLSILKREYEMSISFNHYHIAHHYTYETQTPIGPGIVMEYIDGRNLGEYLAENPSSDSRRRVFYQILDAVAYIHKCGIIHNDLKPENILISRANNDVKLIDFGLSDNDAHYLAKTLGCTPTYASPELLSHGSAIDARSDIYSLGRIMQLILGANTTRCLKSVSIATPTADMTTLTNSVASGSKPNSHPTLLLSFC
jgi:serine/threonine protein kinase